MNVSTVKRHDASGHVRYHHSMGTGDRIRRRRAELGLSQEQLARDTNVSKNTVTRWEAGAVPGGENLDRLAEVLKVSTDWIMRGDERPAPAERDPKHWQDFLVNYPDIEDLDVDDVADLKRAVLRGGDAGRSWLDYVPLANALRDIRRAARAHRVG